MNTKEKPAWFLEKNPNGTVPVLETACGQVIYESPITCEYLEEVFTEKKLCPCDPFERAQQKMLLDSYSKVGSLSFGIVNIADLLAGLLIFDVQFHHKSKIKIWRCNMLGTYSILLLKSFWFFDMYISYICIYISYRFFDMYIYDINVYGFLFQVIPYFYKLSMTKGEDLSVPEKEFKEKLGQLNEVCYYS